MHYLNERRNVRLIAKQGRGKIGILVSSKQDKKDLVEELEVPNREVEI